MRSLFLLKALELLVLTKRAKTVRSFQYYLPASSRNRLKELVVCGTERDCFACAGDFSKYIDGKNMQKK